jgi:hypothetical protein
LRRARRLDASLSEMVGTLRFAHPALSSRGLFGLFVTGQQMQQRAFDRGLPGRRGVK